MSMTINFNLKTPAKGHSLVFVIIRIDGRTLRVSTQQNVLTASFDKKKQRCFTSKEKFSPRDNRHNEDVNKGHYQFGYPYGIPDSDPLYKYRLMYREDYSIVRHSTLSPRT